MGGAGTLALTGDMKQMRSEFVRGASFRGYGVSLAMGVGIPIPILNEDVLKRTCVRDRDILAPVIDYSADYPQNTGKVIGHVSYEQLRSGQIEVEGKVWLSDRSPPTSRRWRSPTYWPTKSGAVISHWPSRLPRCRRTSP